MPSTSLSSALPHTRLVDTRDQRCQPDSSGSLVMDGSKAARHVILSNQSELRREKWEYNERRD